MQREELRTELGKHIYDFSPISKDSIPHNVLLDIGTSFFIRNEIKEYSLESVIPDDFPIWVGVAEPRLELYSDWRNSFWVSGYEAPILELLEKEST